MAMVVSCDAAVVMRGEMSWLRDARNVAVPSPIPYAPPEPQFSQAQSASQKSHLTKRCAVTVAITSPPRAGSVSVSGVTSKCTAA
jgi:hypothetical protein